LQLNVFEPVIAYRLLSSLETLRNGCVVLREKCVDGITANPARMRYFVENSIGIVTALSPTIGYEKATAIAKEALESGRGVYELVLEHKLLSRAELDRLLNPDAMTGR
jgi:aspartate ammonia-lyase